MNRIRYILHYFTPWEWSLWGVSVLLVGLSGIFFRESGGVSTAASLIGVTSLIFNAKGNPVGPLLMIVFSVFYGIISYSCAYYGEMITYLGMSLPMAVVALAAWLRHPSEAGKSEVRINRIRGREYALLALLSAAVTVLFYFILAYFGTAQLTASTLSVTTSFAAAYLTARRSPYFALCYAANDAVLIVLWVLASLADPSYLSVTVCFAVFLVNDLYSFVNWRRMEKRQSGI